MYFATLVLRACARFASDTVCIGDQQGVNDHYLQAEHDSFEMYAVGRFSILNILPKISSSDGLKYPDRSTGINDTVRGWNPK